VPALTVTFGSNCLRHDAKLACLVIQVTVLRPSGSQEVVGEGWRQQGARRSAGQGAGSSTHAESGAYEPRSTRACPARWPAHPRSPRTRVAWASPIAASRRAHAGASSRANQRGRRPALERQFAAAVGGLRRLGRAELRDVEAAARPTVGEDLDDAAVEGDHQPCAQVYLEHLAVS
jgi:hypothetical protein